MAANRITDIKPGLSYSNYKNEFFNCTQVINNTSLMGKFDDYWKLYNSKEPTTTTTGNEIGIPKMSDIQNFSYSVKSQTTGNSVIEPETIIETISDIVKGFFGAGSTMKGGFGNLIGIGISTALEGIKDILKEQVKLHNDVNSALSISGDMSQALRDNIRDTIQPAAAFGYELRDVSDTVINMMQDTGRLSSFSAEVMNKLPSVSRAFVEDMGVLGGYFRQYELVGISAEKTIESIEKGGELSLRLGLNARKVVKETADNISKINEYGFSKGVEGLNRMVQKSIEFRMSMSTAFKIAEDVMDPDVAINLSANLQALGGAIGDLGDPLKMMYMATNNVEGLQDALIGVAGSLATYNKEQGKFELTGVNIRKARELAKQLGIDYKELSNSAIASAERSVAATELLARGLDLKPEQKEFLTNISRMKDGRMVIDVSNMSDQFQGLKEIALGDLTENQKEILLKNQEAFKAMSTEDIAKGQYTETQKLALSVSEIGAMLKIQFAKAINPSLRGVDNQIAKANEYISQALKGKNEGGKEVERIKSEAQKIANDELKVKTEKEKPIKVDNSEKQKQLESNFNNQSKENNIKISIESKVNEDSLRTNLTNHPTFVDDLKNIFRAKGSYTNIEK